MSKATQTVLTNAVTCDECGIEVRLTREDNRSLKVECNCSDRNIRVATAFPSGWM